MLNVLLFGHPQILVDQHPVKLTRRKVRALFYYLAAHRQPIHRNKLLEIFWADEARVPAQQVLRTTIYNLRNEFGAFVVAEDDSISLRDDIRVDVRLFENGLADPTAGPEELTATLQFYRGDFLDGIELPDSVAFDDWVTIERERYRRMAIRALTTLSAWHESQQDYSQALDFLDRALQTNPLQEDLQRESMRLQYLAGDRPGAIRRYDDLRRMLDKEMGVPPMVETRALYDLILSDRPLMLNRPAPTKVRAKLPIDSLQKAAPGFKLPFAGRSKELLAMKTALNHHKVVLIEGEPGIGKTRLAEEFFVNSGALVLMGRAQELEQNLPYLPIIEALRSIFSHPDWGELRPLVVRDVSEVWLLAIERLLPEQAGLISFSLAPSVELDELKLWEGLSQFLLGLARHRPLVLFIDNLHWADSSTIGFLGYLFRQEGARRINFLAAARPFSNRSKLMALVQALTRDDKLQRMPLSRLDQADVQIIAADLMGGAIASGDDLQPAQLGDWLFQKSEGNPYILAELARSRRELQSSAGEQDDGVDRQMTSSDIPESVYRLIQARLISLSEAARRVLDTSVAVGREFDFQVVALAAGLSETAALDALDELVAAGLVLPLDGFRFMFDHHLTLEVAYHEVGELRHRILHRRVAEALESIHPDRLDQMAGLLAWHYKEGNDPVRAAPHASLAGERAANLAAWNEAINFYEQALDGFVGKHRRPVLIAMAEAFSRSGQFVRATEAYRDVLQIDPDSIEKDQQDDIKLALARTLLPQARFSEAIEQARQVVADGNPVNAKKAEITWGTALSIEGSNLEDAKIHLLSARNSCEQDLASDPLIIAQLKFELGSVFAQQGDLDQAVQYYRESLEAANQSDAAAGLEQRILSNNNLAYHLHLLDDPTAKEYALVGLNLAREKGVIGLQAYLLSTIGEIVLAASDLDQAEKYFKEGLEIAERSAIHERVAGLTANLGLVSIKQNQTALAIYRLSKALGQADTLGTHHLAAQIRLWLAPLLPETEARLRLAEVRIMVENSGRRGLLEEVLRLEKGIAE